MMSTGLIDSKVIIRNPGIQSPASQYCSIEVNGAGRRYAKAGIRFSNVGPVSSPIGNVFDSVQQVRQTVLRDVSLNFYRGEANDLAIIMLGAKARADVHNLLMINNLGWISTGPVNDLTALQSGSYEQRAEVTITIASMETQDVTTNAIYETETSVQNESGVEIAAQTITVPSE